MGSSHCLLEVFHLSVLSVCQFLSIALAAGKTADKVTLTLLHSTQSANEHQSCFTKDAKMNQITSGLNTGLRVYFNI